MFFPKINFGKRSCMTIAKYIIFSICCLLQSKQQDEEYGKGVRSMNTQNVLDQWTFTIHCFDKKKKIQVQNLCIPPSA